MGLAGIALVCAMMVTSQAQAGGYTVKLHRVSHTSHGGSKGWNSFNKSGGHHKPVKVYTPKHHYKPKHPPKKVIIHNHNKKVVNKKVVVHKKVVNKTINKKIIKKKVVNNHYDITKIEKVDDEQIWENAEGVAIAIAMGGTPFVRTGDRGAFAMNWGTFDSQNAFAAAGAYHLGSFRNNAVFVTGAVGVGFDHGMVGGRAGVQVNFGGAHTEEVVPLK